MARVAKPVRSTIYLGRATGQGLNNCWVQLVRMQVLTRAQRAELNPDEAAAHPLRQAILIRLADGGHWVARSRLSFGRDETFWGGGATCWVIGKRDHHPVMLRVHDSGEETATPLPDGERDVSHRIVGRDDQHVAVWQYAPFSARTHCRVWRLDGDQWDALAPIPEGDIRTVCVTADGQLLAAGQRWGAWQFDGSTWTWIPFGPAPAAWHRSDRITALMQGANGRLWVVRSAYEVYSGPADDLRSEWKGPRRSVPVLGEFALWREQLVFAADQLYETKQSGVARLVERQRASPTASPLVAEIVIPCAHVRGVQLRATVDARTTLLAVASKQIYEHDGETTRSVDVAKLATLFDDVPAPWETR